MKKLKKGLILLVCICLSGVVMAASVSATAKVITETIEQAAKRSGKVLTPAAREIAETALKKAAAKHGDEVLKMVRSGGLEVLEQGAKHGDEFWKLCAHTPGAARSLALHADEMIPLVRRIGPEFLELEAKTPGLTTKIIAAFGEDSVKTLSKVPPDDISRLIGYASKADAPATSKFLYESYSKSANRSVFLEQLNWKQIMATGLSVAAVTAAYKVSDGIQEGTKIVAKDHPETFKDVVSNLSAPVRYGLYALFAILLYPAALFAWRIGKHILRSKKR